MSDITASPPPRDCIEVISIGSYIKNLDYRKLLHRRIRGHFAEAFCNHRLSYEMKRMHQRDISTDPEKGQNGAIYNRRIF